MNFKLLLSKLSTIQLALIQEISTHDFFFYDALFYIHVLLRTACFEQSVCSYIHNYVVHSSFRCFRMMVRTSSPIVDGGLFGGLEHIA